MKNAKHLDAIIYRSIKYPVSANWVSKIFSHIWIKTSAQLRALCKTPKNLFNLINILLSAGKAKILNAIIKNVFKIAIRLFMNIKRRTIWHGASLSSCPQTLGHSKPQL